MDVQKHQQLCSCNELSRSGGSWARSCRSPSLPAGPWEQSRHVLACPRLPCPRGHRHPRLDVLSPPEPGARMLPSKALPSPGAFAGLCTRVRAGGERGGSPKPPAMGMMPHGTPLRSSLGTRRGRGDPAGPRGSVPPGPAVGVPEPVPGSRLDPAGAAPELGEPAASPLPRTGAGLWNLLKYFSPSLAGPSKFGTCSFTLWASGTREAV